MQMQTPSKHKPQRNFRPWPENQRQFETADAAGLNVSEILNELCARHWQTHVVKRQQQRNRLLKVGAKKGGAR